MFLESTYFIYKICYCCEHSCSYDRKRLSMQWDTWNEISLLTERVSFHEFRSAAIEYQCQRRKHNRKENILTICAVLLQIGRHSSMLFKLKQYIPFNLTCPPLALHITLTITAKSSACHRLCAPAQLSGFCPGELSRWALQLSLVLYTQKYSARI
jgi:hypothetical protein